MICRCPSLPLSILPSKNSHQLFATVTRLRRDDGDEMISFCVQVAEGGRNEDADGILGSRHRKLPLAKQLFVAIRIIFRQRTKGWHT